MKKLVSIIIMAAMVFAFSSCTAAAPAPAATAQTEQPTEATPDAEQSAQPEETAPVEPSVPVASVEDETDALNALLDEISTDVQPGSAGSSLKSTIVAADLLNWATTTTLTESQIKDIVVAWMSPKGNDVQVEFSRAMQFVYESYKTLISEGSAGQMESAGLEYEEGTWGFEPIAAVETIADAVGIEK